MILHPAQAVGSLVSLSVSTFTGMRKHARGPCSEVQKSGRPCSDRLCIGAAAMVIPRLAQAAYYMVMSMDPSGAPGESDVAAWRRVHFPCPEHVMTIDLSTSCHEILG